jgi:poly(A) polymerase
MRYRYSTGKSGELVKRAIIYTRDEHGIDLSDVDGEATGIVKKLKNAGYDSYIVGGAVRDLIIGKKPKDFDIVSSANPARIRKLFRNSRIIGRRFRLVHVYFGQRIFEVSTFRSLVDGSIGNTFGTIDEDVLRRDFTINALFYDPEQQIVIDYVDGINDIKKRQLKPVIPLSEIFKEDPVRMIRAVKYAAITGFSIPFNLKIKIKKQSNLLSSISPSRLTEEIIKILNSEKAGAIVNLLDKMGLYSYIQPEAAKIMREDSSFRQRYLRTMSAFNSDQAVGALFYDFLDAHIDWKPGTIENFKEIYKTARSFILPINPPRYEIEYSLRKFLSAKGITVKRASLHVKPVSSETAEAASVAVKKRNRRRRRHERKHESETIEP